MTTVLEQDFGNPEEVKEEVAEALEKARDECDDCPGWLVFILEALDFLVDNVFDFEDDVLSYNLLSVFFLALLASWRLICITFQVVTRRQAAT